MEEMQLAEHTPDAESTGGHLRREEGPSYPWLGTPQPELGMTNAMW